MRLAIAVIFAAALAVPALAQQPAPPADQPPASGTAPAASSPPATPPPAASTAAPGGAMAPASKRAMCRDKGKQQGMRGSQLRDYVSVCAEEARLSCVKQAVDQKIQGSARKEFMRSCAG